MSERDRVIDYAIDDYRAAYKAAWGKEESFAIGYTNGWICFHDQERRRKPERFRLKEFVAMADRLRAMRQPAPPGGKK